ncbi:MAG: hypothetical protein Q4E75_01160 [bacterium]|nr:hypothetical protein [bacterium]
MKKMLIIGNELHAIRYINVLIFIDEFELYLLNDSDEANKIIKKYNLNKLDIGETTVDLINSFDYIMFTTPNYFNNKYYNIIKEYNGILLFEKPQLNLFDYEDINCKIYFIHLRKFDDNVLDKKNNNYIEWPNLFNDGMDIYINTLPNVIDFIYGLYENKNISEFKILEFKNENNYIELKVNYYDTFLIKIYNTNEKGKSPMMNKTIIGWPNYYNCINNLAKQIISNNLNYKESIKYEKKYIDIVKKLRGDK